MRVQTTSALAVPCARCGALFDLRYDLAQLDRDIAVEEVIAQLRDRNLGRGMLCWECRGS